MCIVGMSGISTNNATLSNERSIRPFVLPPCSICGHGGIQTHYDWYDASHTVELPWMIALAFGHPRWISVLFRVVAVRLVTNWQWILTLNRRIARTWHPAARASERAWPSLTSPAYAMQTCGVHSRQYYPLNHSTFGCSHLLVHLICFIRVDMPICSNLKGWSLCLSKKLRVGGPCKSWGCWD